MLQGSKEEEEEVCAARKIGWMSYDLKLTPHLLQRNPGRWSSSHQVTEQGIAYTRGASATPDLSETNPATYAFNHKHDAGHVYCDSVEQRAASDLESSTAGHYLPAQNTSTASAA